MKKLSGGGLLASAAWRAIPAARASANNRSMRFILKERERDRERRRREEEKDNLPRL